jgi:hypothetical protein
LYKCPNFQSTDRISNYECKKILLAGNFVLTRSVTKQKKGESTYICPSSRREDLCENGGVAPLLLKRREQKRNDDRRLGKARGEKMNEDVFLSWERL